MSRPDGDLGTALAVALVATLAAAALAFGAVHLWAGALLEIAIGALALAAYAERRLRGRGGPATPRGFVLAAAGLVAFLAFQLVPLPRAIVGALSPATAVLHERTRDVLEQVRVPDLPIRPVRSPADAAVPVEERQRIRAAAREVIAGADGAARPLAIEPYRARFELLRYVAYGLALWLAATSSRPRLLLGGIAGAGALLAALAIVEHATWNGRLLWFFVPYDATGPLPKRRMLGPFVNADHFSAFVAFSLGPMLALLAAPPSARDRRRGRRAAADPLRVAVVLVATATMTAAILGSGSRGGIFGALLSAIVVGAAHLRRSAPAEGWRTVRGRVRKNRIARVRRVADRWMPAALAALVLVAGVTYVGPGGREMLDRRLARTVYGGDLEVRTTFWRQTLPLIPEFAAVGTGLGGWREVIPRHQTYPHVWHRQNHSHNDYLEWIVEVGAIGVLLTVALAVAWVRWASANEAIPPLVRAALLGTVVAAAWHEVFDFVLRVPANALLLALALGLLCNRRWEGAAVERETGRPPFVALAKIAVATTLFVALAAEGVGFVREFLDWRRFRAGEAVLVRTPRSAETWEALGELLVRAGLRHHPPTIEAFLAATRLAPTAEEAVYRLARTLPYTADRLRALETAVFLDPTRSEWRLDYAAALERAGLGERALEQIETAARLDPVLARHGYALEKERAVAPAVVAAVERGFRAALAAHGDVPAILSDLAGLLARERRFREAARFWLRAAEASGAWGRFGVRAAHALVQAGDLAGAEATITRTIAEAPDTAHAYRLLALAIQQPEGRSDEALRTLETGLRRSSSRTDLHRAVAALHRAEGREREALAALAKAADSARTNPGLQLDLGAAYVRAGDDHRARAALARTIRLAPEHGEAHYLLGVAEERLHDLSAARESYRRALERSPSNPRYRAALDRVEAAFAELSTAAP